MVDYSKMIDEVFREYDNMAERRDYLKKLNYEIITVKRVECVDGDPIWILWFSVKHH